MTGGSDSATANVVLTNRGGMHARATMKFVDTAQRYRGCTIRVTYRGNEQDGKSAPFLVFLDAQCGAAIRIEASGEEASEAVAALRDLVENRFGETRVVIEFLHMACIKVPLLGTTREEVIRELMDLIERKHNVHCTERLLSATMDREREVPYGTSLGNGIAIPHAVDKTCPGVFTAIGRVQIPFDWPSVDRKPVVTIFLTVGPDDHYKKALIDMSLVLKSRSVRERIALAANAVELLNSLSEESKRLTEEITREIELRESGHHPS